MRAMLKPARTLAAAILLCALCAAPVAGQGVGSTGLEVAQMPAGARAGALAGAYTGVRGDADGVFSNAAAVTGLERAAALSYQRHVLDIRFGSLAGVVRLGRVGVGAGLAFMDGGEIPEIQPDPDFGGQRGRPTGATVSARETTLRLAAGVPLLDGRLHAGGALGFALSELAGISRSAPFADLGVQALITPRTTAGAALRNLGGALSGDGEDVDLPLEARLGATHLLTLPADLGLLLTADLVGRIREETTGLAAGLEFGLMPSDGVGAVLRVGYRAEEATPAANALHLGAGVSFAGVSLDYQYQNLEFFGTAHRIGVRWRGD
jgi:hypothetical protein